MLCVSCSKYSYVHREAFAVSRARCTRNSFERDGLTNKRRVGRLEAVALEDVKKVAYGHIHDTDHALAAVGPVHELPDYMGIRTMSYDNIL